jgi:hypothetical protein
VCQTVAGFCNCNSNFDETINAVGWQMVTQKNNDDSSLSVYCKKNSLFCDRHSLADAATTERNSFESGLPDFSCM